MSRATSASIKDGSFTLVRCDKIVGVSGSRPGFIRVGAVETLSASDTVNLTSYTTHVNTTANLTVQLPVGTIDGQLKMIRNTGANILVINSSDISGGSQVTVPLASDAQVSHAEFMWNGREWLLIDHVLGTLA